VTIPFTDDHSPVYRYLDTNGDGTGTKNANVNGSVTPVVFKISPPSAGKIVLARLIVEVRDTGVFSAEKYGNLATLTNGMQVGFVDDSTGELVTDYTDGLPVKYNAGWGGLCYDVSLKTWGVGDEVLLVRWTFERAGISPILAPGGDAFGVRVRDDLTGLVEHYFHVQGYSKP
jgi:hypothetical protein